MLHFDKVPMASSEASIPIGTDIGTVRNLNLWHRLLPILFFECYLNFTVFLFAYGPWPWPVVNGTKLYTFLALSHLALLLGYLSAALGNPRGYHGRWQPVRLVQISMALNLLLLIPTAITRTGGVLPDVFGGVSNPGLAYAESYLRRSQGNPITEYVRILFGPLLSLLLPLTIYYWRQLGGVTKSLAVLGVAGFIAIYVGMGTNKAIADLILLTPWVAWAGHLSGRLKFTWTKKLRAVTVATIAFVLFVAFFTAGQITRPGSGAVTGYFPATGTFANPDNFMVRRLPDNARTGVVALSSYLTQGYFALYLSLDKPFVPTFGVGNSMFLLRNAAALTGVDELTSMPYPMRIENEGWDAYGLWSSIYPWIASDVTFPGTLVVVFLIGRLFALSWLDSLRGSNPFAVAIFAQFVIMIFYFPANNQLLQGGESLISFYVVLALWMFTRRKYTWGGTSGVPAINGNTSSR